MATSASVSTTGLSARVESAALRLWSPDHIFLITFALGAPGGITLLAINLFRIHLLNKVLLPAFIVISTVLLTPILYDVLLGELPPPFGSIVFLSYYLIVSLVMAGYLASVAQKQIGQCQSTAQEREIEYRGWLSGAGIALACLAVYLVIYFSIRLILNSLGIV